MSLPGLVFGAGGGGGTHGRRHDRIIIKVESLKATRKGRCHEVRHYKIIYSQQHIFHHKSTITIDLKIPANEIFQRYI